MWADAMALMAAFCWAGANTCIARGSSRSGGDNGAFLSILLTFLIAGGVWVAQGGWQHLSAFNPAGLAWFALGGALTIFVGRVFFHSSIQFLGAVRGSSLKRLVPLFSVLLGVVWLGEVLQPSALLGMALIFAGFGVLMVEARRANPAAAGNTARPEQASKQHIRLGLIVGCVSAAAYATGNVSRKFGLMALPDPAFGAMFGALVGVVLFVGCGLFVQSYRHAVRQAFQRPNPWLLSAGLLASAGQLLYFVAIDWGTLSRATLIVSMDVFITIFVALVFFRKREQVTGYALSAAALGVLGTAVIMFGAA